MLEVCSNCKQPIGASETPQVWDDFVVCPKCYAKLSQAAEAPAGEDELTILAEQVAAKRVTPTARVVRQPRRNVSACPDCGGAVSKRAAKCPHCGRELGSFNLARAFLLLIIFLVLMWLFGSALEFYNRSGQWPPR